MDSLINRIDSKMDDEISIEAECLEWLKAMHGVLLEIRERLEQ